MDPSGDIRLGGNLLPVKRADDFQAFHVCLENDHAAKMTDRNFGMSRENILSQFSAFNEFRFLIAWQSSSIRHLI